MKRFYGKPVGNDRERGKITFITKYGLDRSKDILESVIDEAPMNSNPEVAMEPQGWNFQESQEIKPSYTETPAFDKLNSQEAKQFDMPPNVAVLKRLITQLPTGVTKQTGAQIIKQTMEALGISMKSVLQDAQQVQEGLKASARECQGTIQEYKKQILTLERQSQNYQKQYSALNDLISLFIQTTK